MITAIIRNKENTLVLELPHSIYGIYEKLQSIGIILDDHSGGVRRYRRLARMVLGRM